MRQFLVLPVIIIGVIIGVIGLATMGSGHFIIGLVPTAIGAAAVYGSLNFLKGKKLGGGETTYDAPPVPTGFTASFWSKNMAYDQNAGSFWLRDESGATGVLTKSEITSWQAMNESSNHQTTVGPKTVHLNNRLLVRTSNLARPVWTIKFNGHPERTEVGSNRNYAELSEWDARMSAILRS